MGRRREHLFVETDGQVFLVRDRGLWRFPRAGARLPFRYAVAAAMDFGPDVVLRAKPDLSRHPEEWFQRDDLFARADVDGLVLRAVYMTMARLVAEVVFVKRGRVLMEKASRGFSKGHWNIPGGFLDYGERPEEGARRECEEELGVPVRVDRPLATYLSGFPGRPTFTIGFLYRGALGSERFRLKRDEVERVDWLPVPDGLEATRNPFAKWALADAYRLGWVPEVPVRRHIPRRSVRAAPGPVVFADRDGTINRDPGDCVRTPAQLEFRPGAKAALKALRGIGYRLAVISNQDAVAWGLVTHADLRRIHAKLVRELAASGAPLENVYYCPHEAADGCACRKPRPGLLLAACKDLGVSPRDAWMVGDRPEDVLAGKAVGAMTAFLGAPRRWSPPDTAPDLVVPDLATFARLLRSGGIRPPVRPAYT